MKKIVHRVDTILLYQRKYGIETTNTWMDSFLVQSIFDLNLACLVCDDTRT